MKVEWGMERGEKILLWKGNALFGLKDETNNIEAIFWAFHARLSSSQMFKCGFCKMGPCGCPSYPAPEGPPCASYKQVLVLLPRAGGALKIFYQVFGREIPSYPLLYQEELHLLTISFFSPRRVERKPDNELPSNFMVSIFHLLVSNLLRMGQSKDSKPELLHPTYLF